MTKWTYDPKSGHHIDLDSVCLLTPEESAELRRQEQEWLDQNSFETAMLGFRVWGRKHNRLTAISAEHSWKPGINSAECYWGRHEAPDEKCDCGFNAWYRIDEAICYYPGILGAIAGAGRMEKHGKGFRCSEAQIIALYSGGQDLDKIGEIYGVPVFDDFKEFRDFALSAIPADQKLLDSDPQIGKAYKRNKTLAAVNPIEVGIRRFKDFCFSYRGLFILIIVALAATGVLRG